MPRINFPQSNQVISNGPPLSPLSNQNTTHTNISRTLNPPNQLSHAISSPNIRKISISRQAPQPFKLPAYRPPEIIRPIYSAPNPQRRVENIILPPRPVNRPSLSPHPQVQLTRPSSVPLFQHQTENISSRPLSPKFSSQNNSVYSNNISQYQPAVSQNIQIPQTPMKKSSSLSLSSSRQNTPQFNILPR